jgi:hypothetical protein
VVVKIRRPGIVDTIEADLRLLDRAAVVAEREWPALEPYRPRLLVRQFGRRCGASWTWPPNAATPSAWRATWPRCRWC